MALKDLADGVTVDRLVCNKLTPYFRKHTIYDREESSLTPSNLEYPWVSLIGYQDKMLGCPQTLWSLRLPCCCGSAGGEREFIRERQVSNVRRGEKMACVWNRNVEVV